MFVAVVHRIIGSNEDRHVVTCLARQVRVDIPKIAFASGTADGFVHVSATAVISCDDEVPVLINSVHAVQEPACGIGGADRVHSFVHQRVHFQSVYLRRGRHELPKTGCSDVRTGGGVERGLDDRQVLQFIRQVVTAQGLFEHREIILAHSHHPRHLFGAPFDVPYYERAHALVIGQLDDARQCLQTRFVNGIGQGSGVVYRFAERGVEPLEAPFQRPHLYVGQAAVVPSVIERNGRHDNRLLGQQAVFHDDTIYGQRIDRGRSSKAVYLLRMQREGEAR